MTVAVTGVVVPFRTSLTVDRVIVPDRMDSEKVTRTLTVGETPVAPDEGLTAFTTGLTVSTLQVRFAGVISRLPAPSVAATSKVWLPWLSEE